MSRKVVLLLTFPVLAGVGIAIGTYSSVEEPPHILLPEPTQDAPSPDTASPSPQRTLIPRQSQSRHDVGPVVEVEISFVEGITVPVQLKPVNVVHPPYVPARRLLEQYDELARMAEKGDAPAARMLYRALKWCSMLFAGRATGGVAPKEDLEERFRYCDGISDEHLDEAPLWAEMAATGGDYLGRQDWAYELGSTPDGFQVWESLWKDGNISALPSIAYAYQHAIPTSTGGEPDHLRAYAYHLIYFKIQDAARAVEAAAPQVSRRRSLGAIVALEDYQSYLGSMLNPQEQEEAEALAAELLRQNNNCCTGTF